MFSNTTGMVFGDEHSLPGYTTEALSWSHQWRFKVADKELTAGVLGVSDGCDVGAPTLTENDGNMQVISNKLDITGQTTPANWDLKVQDLTGISQVFATGSFARQVDLSSGIEILIGLSYSSSGLRSRSYHINIDANISRLYMDGPSGEQFRATLNSTYDFAILAGGYDVSKKPYVSGDTKSDFRNGTIAFIKGGAFTSWTMLAVGINSVTSLQTSFFPGIEARDNDGAVDGFGVPDPTVHTYDAIMDLGFSDLFTDTNGTALSSHTMNVGGGTWSNGNFQVVTGNVAECALAGETTFESSESDPVITCAVTIHATKTNAGGIVYRYADSSNYWYLEVSPVGSTIAFVEVNAGTPTTRLSTAFTFVAGTTYHIGINVYGDSMQLASIDGLHKLAYTTTNTFSQTEGAVGIKDTATVNLQFDNFRLWPRTNAAYESNFDAPIAQLA